MAYSRDQNSSLAPSLISIFTAILISFIFAYLVLIKYASELSVPLIRAHETLSEFIAYGLFLLLTSAFLYYRYQNYITNASKTYWVTLCGMVPPMVLLSYINYYSCYMDTNSWHGSTLYAEGCGDGLTFSLLVFLQIARILVLPGTILILLSGIYFRYTSYIQNRIS